MAIKRNVEFHLEGADYERLAPVLPYGLRSDLEAALHGEELNQAQALAVADARGIQLAAVATVADRLRKEKVGEHVSYVVNRNINFTNICFVGCTFCCFGKSITSPDAYWHSLETVADRAEQAWRRGATEVCVQGGLPPELNGSYYFRVLEAIKQRVPEMHIHAYSPMEVVYGVERTGMPLPEYLIRLREAGLG